MGKLVHIHIKAYHCSVAGIPIVITFRRSQTLKILFGSINIFHFQIRKYCHWARTYFGCFSFAQFVLHEQTLFFVWWWHRRRVVGTLTLKHQKIAFSHNIVHCHYARTRTILFIKICFIYNLYIQYIQ